jgi:hypothetical protein
MPSWQITTLISMLLFVVGALILVSSQRKQTLLEGYSAWIVATLIMVIGFYTQPNSFAALRELFARFRGSITEPAIAVAAFCLLIVEANLIMALLDKNARLFGKPAPLDEIRLGQPDPTPIVKRSPMRCLADAFSLRSRRMTEAASEPELKVEPANNGGSAWLAMLNSERLRDALGISAEELQMLTQVEFMGEVSTPHELRLVLRQMRSARAKTEKEAASDAQLENRSAPEKLASPAVKSAG